MRGKLLIGLLAAMLSLGAGSASADCVTSVFGLRIVKDAGDVRVYTAANGRPIYLCSFTDGTKCQALMSLAMAAQLSRRQLRFSSGGGNGTCDEYVAETREWAYVVLE